MANDMRYLSAEEEAKLLKPIDEYVGMTLIFSLLPIT